MAVAGPAWAGSGTTTGSGKLPAGATFGFNAKADLSGSIEFQSADGTLDVHCHGLVGYKSWTKGPNLAWFDSQFASETCHGQGHDPNTYRVWVDAVDKGEPGIHDRVRIKVFRLDGGVRTLLYDESGLIQNGNLQVQV
jgi:hypothetical protein